MINYKVLSYLNRMNKFAEMQAEMDIFGYKTKQFYICPGAQELFKELMSSDDAPLGKEDEIIRMIRTAAGLADKVFGIEKQVLADKSVTQEKVDEAILLVNDFKNTLKVIESLTGETYDVAFMDGHIVTIKSYL